MDETLDNEIFGGATIKGDVSIAMGWNFTLANELYIATVDFILSDTAPSSDFYLIHNDPEGAYSIYLSSQLTLVPEPGTSLLIGCGLAGLALLGRRQNRTNIRD